MNRAEHLAWAKERALAYADAGDAGNALASITSDLRKHKDTADHQGIELMAMLAYGGHLRTPGQIREFVEGLN